MTKPGIRDSLVTMLGEFVGLSRNPEYRLSSSSEQFLADAINAEKKASTCSSTSSRGSIVNIYVGMVSTIFSFRDPKMHFLSTWPTFEKNFHGWIHANYCSIENFFKFPKFNFFSFQDPISHQRSNSTPIRRNVPKRKDSESSRRLSVPLLRPKYLLKRFQRHSGSYDPNPTNIVSTRQNSIISESEEEADTAVLAELPKSKRTRNYSQSSSILGDLAKSGHVRCQPLMVSIH
jgi:hypothetical protein